MSWRVWIEPKPHNKFIVRRRSHQGKNLPAQTCSTKRLANRLRDKWQDELELKSLGLTDPNANPQRLYADYLVEVEKRLALNTVLTIKRILPKYLAGKEIAAELTTDSIRDWRRELFKRYKLRTIKNHLRHLSAWFSWLEREGHLEIDPFKNIEIPNPDPDPHYMFESELVALDKKARGDVKLMFRIAFTTGMRQANTLQLRGEWIQDNHFVVPRTKNRRPAAFPIDPLVATLLPKRPKQGPLFPGWTRYKLRHEFDALRKLAGVRREVTWHSAKHTFIQMALRSGLSKPEVQQLVGNLSSLSMDAYTVFERGGLKERHGQIRFPKQVGR